MLSLKYAFSPDFDIWQRRVLIWNLCRVEIVIAIGLAGGAEGWALGRAVYTAAIALLDFELVRFNSAAGIGCQTRALQLKHEIISSIRVECELILIRGEWDGAVDSTLDYTGIDYTRNDQGRGYLG